MASRQPTILLADDSATVREMVSYYLRQNNFHVVCAKDGVEVVEKAMDEMPDIIVLDLMMPRMNGYQSCRLLKNEPSTADIPVIILTSQDQASRQYWGMQAGADAYVTKDSDLEALVTAIRQLLLVHQGNKRKKTEKRKSNTSIDIIAAANAMLDQKLFESTIINEVGRLSTTLDDLAGTMRRVLHILETLIDFCAGAVVLVGDSDDDEDSGLVALRIKSEAPDSVVEEIRSEIRETLPGPKNRPRAFEDLKEICFEDTDRPHLKPVCVKEPVYISARPFRARERAGGMIALARIGVAFSEEDERILDIVAKHSFTVLDNARLYDKVKRLSIMDGMLKIYNRRYVEEHLEKEFERACRYGGEFSVLIVDFDHFKVINDQYGHQTGDRVLARFADLVKSVIRSVDVLGRYGGDEFIILLPETGLDGALAIAERIRTVIADKLRLEEDPDRRITASIGLSTYPDGGVETVAEFLARADRALYLAKETGRNRVCTHLDVQ